MVVPRTERNPENVFICFTFTLYHNDTGPQFYGFSLHIVRPFLFSAILFSKPPLGLH